MIPRILPLLLLIVATLCSPAHAIQSEHRMAIDIGSGTTHYTIAEVNPETGKIVRIVDSGRFDAAYRIDLITSPNRQFSPQMFDRAVDVFQRLRSKYDYFGVSRARVIARQSFRLAGNHQQLANKVQKKTGFVIHTMSREEEDQLDYFTALRASQTSSRPIVWDIAADSYQLIVEDELQEPFTHLGDFGSMDFLDYMLEVVQQKQPGPAISLHPLSQSEASAGILFARFLARQAPAIFSRKIAENNGAVLAIGTLFRNSIGDGNRSKITQSELLQTINKQLVTERNEPHSQGNPLNNPDRFSHTRLANALLVYGMMLELGINKLNIAGSDASESLLEFMPYWQ